MWPFHLLFDDGLLFPLIAAATGLILTFSFAKFLFKNEGVLVKDLTMHHNWTSAKVLSKTLYCSVCESMLLNGFGMYCDCCGVCADQECVSKADKILLCKANTVASCEMAHHWVKGNLPLGASCDICGDDCSMESGLVDYQCCWCTRCVHTKCLKKESKYCDLGPFRCLIVPPWCLQINRRKNSVRKSNTICYAVKDPGWYVWTPLIVVANKNSGNGDGDIILSEFRKVLHPAQVIDLSERSPESALEWARITVSRRVKIVVAGGDGTVAWINSTIERMNLKPLPAIAIIPLGTGNDLSRVLGWGESTNACEMDIIQYMKNIKEARIDKLDRWKMEVISYNRGLNLRRQTKVAYMYNYMSIGADAQVALDFHKARESKLYICKNRLFNKMLYLFFGTQQVVIADYQDLQQRMEVFLDDEKVELPSVEAIVMVNIPSWGAGVNLWELSGSHLTQSYNDGKIEVLGISSSFQMAQLQIGMSKPYVIGQASKVEIRLLCTSALQVDGEPWLQCPACIRVSVVSPTCMLVNETKERGCSKLKGCCNISRKSSCSRCSSEVSISNAMLTWCGC